jgi:hypothetical protein
MSSTAVMPASGENEAQPVASAAMALLVSAHRSVPRGRSSNGARGGGARKRRG